MMSLEPIIKVEGLVKKYDNFTAVDQVSFNVYPGEIFGLLGPNGAGKTTSLEIIETLRPKTAGKIWVDGLDLDNHVQEIKQRIGVQLQAASYSPHLTLRQLLRLFAGLYNCEIKPMEILEKVGLTEKANQKFSALSGGQKQRFSIASSIIHNPKILFLDEPSTGLDPQARRKLWDLILNLNRTGITIVLTTHYMDEAEVLCNRIGIMDAGRIVKLDTPDGLIEQLLKTGFLPSRPVKSASLEDVFLYFTGKELEVL